MHSWAPLTDITFYYSEVCGCRISKSGSFNARVFSGIAQVDIVYNKIVRAWFCRVIAVDRKLANILGNYFSVVAETFFFSGRQTLQLPVHCCVVVRLT